MIRPLHSNFVIEKIKEEETATGLRYATAKPKAKAKVLAIPQGEDEIKVGDFVVIDKNMPYDLPIDGVMYTFITRDDIFAIL